MSGTMTGATIVGRLTRDAELKYTNSGTAICNFSIATNHKTKKGDAWVEEADYWSVELWGKLGEAISQYLTKGKQVAVRGPMQQDRWEQDGQQRMKVVIKAEGVELLGGGQRDDQQRQDTTRQPEEPRRDPAPRQPAQPQASSDDMFSDDIPF